MHFRQSRIHGSVVVSMVVAHFGLHVFNDCAAQDDSIADAIVKVKVDVNQWAYFARFAEASQAGVDEKKVRSVWPGFKFDAIPESLLALSRHPAASVPELIGCLDDDRVTGIGQVDVLGNPDKDTPALTCGEAAVQILLRVVPLGDFNPKSERSDQVLDEFIAHAKAWAKEAAELMPAERIKRWYARASKQQRLEFMVLALELQIEPAFPLIEQEFIERAKKPDDYLTIELWAWCRQRRDKAAKLLKQVKPAIEPQNRMILYYCESLVEKTSLESSIQQWIDGEIEYTELAFQISIAITMPWRTHSMKVERTGMHRPVLEKQIQTLIAAASKTDRLGQRTDLMKLAKTCASNLHEVLERSEPVYPEQVAPPGASAMKETCKHLQEILDDDRLVFTGRQLESPASVAAEIVWEFWAPNDREMDVLFRSGKRDWRNELFELHFCDRSIRIQAAREILDRKERLTPEVYPAAQAARVIDSLKGDSAAQWRKRIDKLDWEQQLMLWKQAQHSEGFSKRFQSRKLQFVNWRNPADQKNSFKGVWERDLEGVALTSKSWAALKQWLASETLDQRFWLIMGESHPTAPGLTLYLLPQARCHTRSTGKKTPGQDPVLRVQVGEYEFREEYAIVGGKLANKSEPGDKDSGFEQTLKSLTDTTEDSYVRGRPVIFWLLTAGHAGQNNESP